MMKCHLCNNDNAKEYTITGRGFGSELDGLTIRVHLCNCCKPREFDEWVNEICEYEDYLEIYPNEYKLMEFLNSLSWESKEEIFNSTADGISMKLPKYLWVAYYKDELSDDEMWGEL